MPVETNNPPERWLSGRHIVLGVTGGVAAYKAVELCRRLTDAGARVSPVMSANATRFIGVATFAALTSDAPVVDLWTNDDPSPHTSLGKSADLVLIAPATARVIASYAHGTSEDALATTLLATRAPVVLCPAMHTEMWENPAVVANIATLRDRGAAIVEPESGALAGGDVGVGRLAGVDMILRVVRETLSPLDLAGKTVLVTAGGTREPIDPVRYIGNRSSGKQGHAIASEAASRGARVILVTAAPGSPVNETEHVNTADEMRNAVMKHLDVADIIVMAAAVADFRPVTNVDTKLKKTDGVPQIILEPTIDILGEVAECRRGDQIIVGFAAETNDVEAYAREKLLRKRLDFIVANDVSRSDAGMYADMNSALIIDAAGEAFPTGLVGKRTVATNLFDRIVRHRIVRQGL